MTEDAQGSAGENLLALLKERARTLQLAPFVRERAEARVKAEGITGMDEGRLWKEWMNDVLADAAPEAYERVVQDPVRYYEEFVGARIAHPYHVTYRAVRALEKRVGADEANKFVHLHWNQEIAWAKRMRASDSARTAVLSHMFLLAVAKEPGKVFADLAATWMAAWSEGNFSRSTSHDLTEHAIRHGNVQPAHEPVYLGLFMRRLGENLDRMPVAKLSAAAGHARASEEGEVRAVVSAKAAAVARHTPLSRIMGVIGIAIETGRSSNMLWADETRFLTELERGRIHSSAAGLPYSEFVAWLRAEAPGEDPGPPAPGHDEFRNLTQLLARPSSWLASLPSDYLQSGASEAAAFHAWLTPISRRETVMPRDLVADYGFHLVKKTYRR